VRRSKRSNRPVSRIISYELMMSPRTVGVDSLATVTSQNKSPGAQ
jgi:hypothetical protein